MVHGPLRSTLRTSLGRMRPRCTESAVHARDAARFSTTTVGIVSLITVMDMDPSKVQVATKNIISEHDPSELNALARVLTTENGRAPAAAGLDKAMWQAEVDAVMPSSSSSCPSPARSPSSPTTARIPAQRIRTSTAQPAPALVLCRRRPRRQPEALVERLFDALPGGSWPCTAPGTVADRYISPPFTAALWRLGESPWASPKLS